MPTNKQRVAAVLTTAALVMSGAWTASLAKLGQTNGKAVADGIAVSKPVPKTENTQDSKLETSVSAEQTNNPYLTVSINGVRNSKGKIYIMVFDNAAAYASYDYQQAVGFAELPASTRRITTKFPDLADKAYAVSVFHDENGNQQFDMQGDYPAEGYGTSLAKSAYDNLKFHQAIVGPGPIGVRIFYLN